MGLDGSWQDALLRAVVAAVSFVTLFLVARYRWRERDSDHGPADSGLD